MLGRKSTALAIAAAASVGIAPLPVSLAAQITNGFVPRAARWYPLPSARSGVRAVQRAAAKRRSLARARRAARGRGR